MTTDRKNIWIQHRRGRGFSVLEVVIVVFVILVLAGITIPNILLMVANMRLRASAGDLAGLMQQGRILAAKSNRTFAIRYAVRNNARIAYVDLNNDGNFNANEPLIEFSGTTAAAAGAPTGGIGQPTPYVLPEDPLGASWDNTQTLGYTGRGLPCNFDGTTVPPTCTTPPARYFVYYLTDTRPTRPGWAAVVVTKGGRTKTVVWNGAAWN